MTFKMSRIGIHTKLAIYINNKPDRPPIALSRYEKEKAPR